MIPPLLTSALHQEAAEARRRTRQLLADLAEIEDGVAGTLELLADRMATEDRTAEREQLRRSVHRARAQADRIRERLAATAPADRREGSA